MEAVILINSQCYLDGWGWGDLIKGSFLGLKTQIVDSVMFVFAKDLIFFIIYDIINQLSCF